MKKIISLLIVLTMIIGVFASCADNTTTSTESNTTSASTSHTTVSSLKITPKSYSAAEYLNGDLSFYLEHLHTDEAGYLESAENYADYTDEAKAGIVQKINIDGKTYDFTYKKSRNNDRYNHNRTDFYICNINGDIVNAEYNATLGKITAIYSIVGKGSSVITRDEAFEKAKAFLAKEISSASEYELTYENERSNNTYYFRFNRFTDGVKTSETAAVSMNFDGTVNSYKFIGTGSFDGVDISGIDMNAVDAVIKEKTDEIYSGYSYEITARDFTLNRTADGTFVLDFNFKADVSGKDLEKVTQDRMCMFVFLG